jgi:hypothetical protein
MSSEPTAKTDLHTHTAVCHCGAVKVTFKHTPLDNPSTEINACNCSICTKNGYINTYPKHKDVTVDCPEGQLTSYRWKAGDKPHKFCKTCGSSMLIDFSESDVPQLKDLMAINVRFPFIGNGYDTDMGTPHRFA